MPFEDETDYDSEGCVEAQKIVGNNSRDSLQ